MRDLPTFLAGGMAGVAILRLHTDSATYTRALGLLLLANGAVLIVRKPVIVNGSHPAIDLGAGFLSGIIGGVTGFPSAFVAPWCGMRGWSKTRRCALFQPFILVMRKPPFSASASPVM